MTAANVFAPKSSEARLADSRTQEPSMEDILASIRRIIADDQLQASRPGYGGPRRVASPAAAPLERDAAETAEHPVENRRIGSDDRVDFARAAPEAEPAAPYVGRPTIVEPPPAPLSPATAQPDADLLLPDEAGGSFDKPAPYSNGHAAFIGNDAGYAATEAEPESEHAAWANDTQPLAVSSSDESASGDALMSPALGASVMSAFETLAATVVLQNTEMLERIMRELLRPLVKTWLDENLPTLVERLVRHEIERVARGGRG